MTMKVNQTKGTQGTQRSNGIKSKDYSKQQEALGNKIKMPHGVRDLKYNAGIKEEQIRLAKANGDFDVARILQDELNKINKEIEAKETSVFDEAKKDKNV